MITETTSSRLTIARDPNVLEFRRSCQGGYGQCWVSLTFDGRLIEMVLGAEELAALRRWFNTNAPEKKS